VPEGGTLEVTPRDRPDGPRLEPGRRQTRQRRLVWQAIREVGPHCTADDVTACVKRADPRISRSTVYRILAAMTSSGDVVAARLDAGALRYELAATEHHHAVCQVCGTVTHLGDELVKTLEEHLAVTLGFRAVRTDLTVAGICRSCAAGGRRAIRRPTA
jgi:Fur family ferric uptake transcriptional regulator